MRLRTSLLAAAVALTTAYAGSAQAAPVCNLVKDETGDMNDSPTPGTPSVDVTGADIASSATKITAVVRVAKLSKTDSGAPLGQAWFFQFLPKGLPEPNDFLFLAAYSTPTGGDEFVVGRQAPHATGAINTSYKVAEATGEFDEAKSEVRITADIAAFGEFAALLKPGSSLGTLTADARQLFGQRAVPSPEVGGVLIPSGGLTFTQDTAEGTKAYVAGEASCLAVGK